MKIKGLYQKRGWYYWQPPSRQGKRPPAIALKTRDEQEAIDRAFGHFSADAVHAQSPESMRVLLKAYLEEQFSNGTHSGRTSNTTKKCLEALCDEWGNPRVTAISSAKIEAWRQALRKRPGMGEAQTMSEASIASYLMRLRGFLSWCVKKKHLREHPMASMRIGRVKKTRVDRFCTLEEREKLLADPPNEEIGLILHVGFFAGLRFEEVLAMTPDWIVGRPGNLVISVEENEHWKPKDGEARMIPMHPRLEAFLEDYGMRRPYLLRPDKKEWKAPPKYRYNPKRALKNYAARCGLGWISYYTLRHTFATHLAMAGAPIAEIAGLMGNSIQVCQDNYVGFSPAFRSRVTDI